LGRGDRPLRNIRRTPGRGSKSRRYGVCSRFRASRQGRLRQGNTWWGLGRCLHWGLHHRLFPAGFLRCSLLCRPDGLRTPLALRPCRFHHCTMLGGRWQLHYLGLHRVEEPGLFGPLTQQYAQPPQQPSPYHKSAHHYPGQTPPGIVYVGRISQGKASTHGASPQSENVLLLLDVPAALPAPPLPPAPRYPPQL